MACPVHAAARSGQAPRPRDARVAEGAAVEVARRGAARGLLLGLRGVTTSGTARRRPRVCSSATSPPRSPSTRSSAARASASTCARSASSSSSARSSRRSRSACRKPEACASCTTHDCLRGNAAQRGCELDLFLPRKAGNLDCTFCLDCVKACPHDAIGILPVLPGRELVRDLPRSSAIGRFAARPGSRGARARLRRARRSRPRSRWCAPSRARAFAAARRGPRSSRRSRRLAASRAARASP